MTNSKTDNPFESPVDAKAEDHRVDSMMWQVCLGWQLPLVSLALFFSGGGLQVIGLPVVFSIGFALAAMMFLFAGMIMTIYGLCLTNSVRGIEKHVLAGILVNLFVLLGVPCSLVGVLG